MKVIVSDTLPADAKKIRENVFMAEQGFRDEFDEYENISTHLVGYIDGAAVATARIRFSEEFGAWKIERIAVDKSRRKMGLGEEIVGFAENLLSQKAVEEVVVLAQDQAVGFYEKIGYHAEDYTCMEEHCLHILMRKKI